MFYNSYSRAKFNSNSSEIFENLQGVLQGGWVGGGGGGGGGN